MNLQLVYFRTLPIPSTSRGSCEKDSYHLTTLSLLRFRSPACLVIVRDGIRVGFLANQRIPSQWFQSGNIFNRRGRPSLMADQNVQGTIIIKISDGMPLAAKLWGFGPAIALTFSSAGRCCETAAAFFCSDMTRMRFNLVIGMPVGNEEITLPSVIIKKLHSPSAHQRVRRPRPMGPPCLQKKGHDCCGKWNHS